VTIRATACLESYVGEKSTEDAADDAEEQHDESGDPDLLRLGDVAGTDDFNLRFADKGGGGDGGEVGGAGIDGGVSGCKRRMGLLLTKR